MSNETFKSSFTITPEQFKSADMSQLENLSTSLAKDGIKSHGWGYDGKKDTSGKLIHCIVGKLEYDFSGRFDVLTKLAASDASTDEEKKAKSDAQSDLYNKWYDATKISLRAKPTSLARLAIGLGKTNKTKEKQIVALMAATKMDEKTARSVIYGL